MARSALRFWVALALLATACSLNPQPEPPAASDEHGPVPPDAAAPTTGTGGTSSPPGGAGGAAQVPDSDAGVIDFDDAGADLGAGDAAPTDADTEDAG
jgi:hypothetical protein